MPRVHGDTFRALKINYVIFHDEELLNTTPPCRRSFADHGHVASLSTMATPSGGVRSMPNAIVSSMGEKNNPIHTEPSPSRWPILSKGPWTIRGSLSTGARRLPLSAWALKIRTNISMTTRLSSLNASYTNNLVISQNNSMRAINAALQIDLTGHAESIGNQFFSGIGRAPIMRGALLSLAGPYWYSSPRRETARSRGSCPSSNRAPV